MFLKFEVGLGGLKNMIDNWEHRYENKCLDTCG